MRRAIAIGGVALLVSGIVAAMMSLFAGGGPSSAAIDPSQQFMTSAAGTPNAPGQSIALAFGASGVTGTYTLSTVTNGGSAFASGVFPGANVTTYLEPDPPPESATVAQTMFPTSLVIGTVVLSQPVEGLILHVVNPDASHLAVSGTSTTGDPITLMPLVKNTEMEITGNTLNSTPAAPVNGGCETDAEANPNGACGSIALTAASGRIQSFTLTSTGTALGNDGWGWTLSFDLITSISTTITSTSTTTTSTTTTSTTTTSTTSTSTTLPTSTTSTSTTSTTLPTSTTSTSTTSTTLPTSTTSVPPLNELLDDLGLPLPTTTTTVATSRTSTSTSTPSTSTSTTSTTRPTSTTSVPPGTQLAATGPTGQTRLWGLLMLLAGGASRFFARSITGAPAARTDHASP